MLSQTNLYPTEPLELKLNEPISVELGPLDPEKRKRHYCSDVVITKVYICLHLCLYLHLCLHLCGHLYKMFFYSFLHIYI